MISPPTVSRGVGEGERVVADVGIAVVALKIARSLDDGVGGEKSSEG
jgi:hypothetical protein